MPVLGRVATTVAEVCSGTKKRHASGGVDMGKSLQEASATKSIRSMSHRESATKTPQALHLLVAVLVTLAALLTMLSATGYSAHAEEADDSINSVLNLGSDDPVAAQVFVLINTGLKSDPDKYGMEEDLLTYDSGTHLLTFNNTGYSGLDLSEKRETMKYTLDSIASSTMTNQHRLKVYNFVCDQDTGVSQAIRWLSSDASADVASAADWLSPYASVISTTWGVLCIIILTMLALTMTLDLAYMTIPPLRSLLTSSKKGRPWFVSVEAFNAIKHADDTGGNYLAYYLKKRFVSCIIIGTIIVMMVTGKIFEPFLYFGSYFA